MAATGLLLLGLILLVGCQGTNPPPIPLTATPDLPAATPTPDTPVVTPAPTSEPEPVIPSASAPAPAPEVKPAPLSSLTGDVAPGEVIFQKTAGGSGCAFCHGSDAMGISAPRIIDKEAEDLQFALLSVPAMGYMNLTNQDIADVAAYLQYMKSETK